jgi:serine O-acetyltransferase
MSASNGDRLYQFAEELQKNHEHRSHGLQLKKEAGEFVEALLSLLFPHFSKERVPSREVLDAQLVLMKRDIVVLLSPLVAGTPLQKEDIAEHFIQALPEIYRKLWLDAEAISSGDPAAQSIDEVILAYPGFYAIAIYRFAHEFHKSHVPVFPRLLTEYAHERTAIDIHPGASIGESFAIDHGTGIVIGESTTIGNHVKIYQGVTLGAASVDKKMAKSKRHPTIEDHAVIYAHAVILGGDTVIGHHSIIGGNVWMTESVAPYSIVYHERDVIVQNQLDKKGALHWVI